MKDLRQEIKILIAGIGETQSWLAKQLGKSKQVISQKMNAKTVKFEFYEKALKAIQKHPAYNNINITRDLTSQGNNYMIARRNVDNKTIEYLLERVKVLEKEKAELERQLGEKSKRKS